MANKGAEAVGFALAPARLTQPRPDGHNTVPFGGQPHGTINLQQDLYSRYHFDNKKIDLNIDPRLLGNAANPRGPIISRTDVQSMGRSEATAFTGLVPDTGTGSIAWSETNEFTKHAEERLTTPLLAIEDGDEPQWPLGPWEDEMSLARDKEERSVASELVPGADYAQDLESDLEILSMFN